MNVKDPLGSMEYPVLTAVHLLGDNAYGISVHAKVEEMTGRSVKLPSVYRTLDRFEDKRYVKSWLAEPTEERGGKRKRFFRLLPAGERALRESKHMAKRIADAIEKLGVIP